MYNFFSAVLLIIGAVIGGGIIAIPIASATFGFYTTLFLILASWLLMTKTGLYILKLSLAYPKKYNTYYTIVGHYLGKKMQRIVVLAFLFLFYFTLASYISGCTDLLMSHFNHHYAFSYYPLLSLFLVTLLGTILIISAKLVIRLNVFIVSFKIAFLLLAIVTSFSHFLPLSSKMSTPIHFQPLMALSLIIINAFGFHFIIPSLVSYYGKKPFTFYKRLLITSTSLVCLLYVLWLMTVYCLLPLKGNHGLIAIYHSDNQLLQFNQSLHFYLRSPMVVFLINAFQSISLFGSFLCVSLGLFDFLVDAFKTNNRFYAGLITFTPPLLLSFLSENMYLIAMAYAGFIALFLEVLVPIWTNKKQMIMMAP